MIYACIRFLQEWAHPLTVVNFILLGCASGYTFAAAYADLAAPALEESFIRWAVIFTVAAFFTRAASLVRNRRIKPRSSLQTAIGVKHPKVVQKAQGFMGGSFNTREFFHGRTPALVRAVKWFFLTCVFAVPVLLLLAAAWWNLGGFAVAAFVVQYAGLIAERWYFFAERGTLRISTTRRFPDRAAALHVRGSAGFLPGIGCRFSMALCHRTKVGPTVAAQSESR